MNRTICTLIMLTNDITLGSGLLGKIEFTKPYWYGLEKLLFIWFIINIYFIVDIKII